MMMNSPYAVRRTLDSLMAPQYPRKERTKMKAPHAISMYAPCSITVGSVSSLMMPLASSCTPSSTVNLAKCAKWMKEVLSTASQTPTQSTAEPTTKKAKLKRQRTYLAHVAPQSATMVSEVGVEVAMRLRGSVAVVRVVAVVGVVAIVEVVAVVRVVAVVGVVAVVVVV